MANRYSVPLVLSLHDGIKLLQRRSDIQSALEQTRREFSETTLRGAKLGLCNPRDRGARAKVLIRYETNSGAAPVSLTYFLIRNKGRLCIEMIEMAPGNPFERWYRAFSILPAEHLDISSSARAIH